MPVNPYEAPKGDSRDSAGAKIERKLFLTRLLKAAAWFSGSYASIVLIAYPAAEGAFDTYPPGFYAILIGVVAACFCAGMGTAIAFEANGAECFLV